MALIKITSKVYVFYNLVSMLTRLFLLENKMAKLKNENISELINEYDEEFVQSISLKDVSSSKKLKELLNKLEKANSVITSFYQTLYNDYIISINSDEPSLDGPDIDMLKKYKRLSSKIQNAYKYILYLSTFENPFKICK